MILEAFSIELKRPENQGGVPERVLFDWLVRYLLVPPGPDDHIAHILHHELLLHDYHGHVGIEARTDTGHQLLRSLYTYCRSYDHWQFSRWLHQRRASDFSA